MPVVVPIGFEEKWIEQIKDLDQLKELSHILIGWSCEEWIAEDLRSKQINQINLFEKDSFL